MNTIRLLTIISRLTKIVVIVLNGHIVSAQEMPVLYLSDVEGQSFIKMNTMKSIEISNIPSAFQISHFIVDSDDNNSLKVSFAICNEAVLEIAREIKFRNLHKEKHLKKLNVIYIGSGNVTIHANVMRFSDFKIEKISNIEGETVREEAPFTINAERRVDTAIIEAQGKRYTVPIQVHKSDEKIVFAMSAALPNLNVSAKDSCRLIVPFNWLINDILPKNNKYILNRQTLILSNVAISDANNLFTLTGEVEIEQEARSMLFQLSFTKSNLVFSQFEINTIPAPCAADDLGCLASNASIASYGDLIEGLYSLRMRGRSLSKPDATFFIKIYILDYLLELASYNLKGRYQANGIDYSFK